MTAGVEIGSVLWNVRVPARDGVELATDVVLPPGSGPFPAVLTRTPYLRGRNLRPTEWMSLVNSGYAYVVQDVRGRGDSDGEWVPYVNDAEDGYDAIEWVAAQPWCTGAVGMVGNSYEGRVQWFAAKEHPPSLRCIAPMGIGVANDGPRWNHNSGITAQYWLWWLGLVSGRTFQNPASVSWTRDWQHRPLRDIASELGIAKRGWAEFAEGNWDRSNPAHLFTDDDWNNFDVPTLVTLGWWDDQPTVVNWERLRRSPAFEQSKLLIGAWDHSGNVRPRPVIGGLDVSESVMDTKAYVERFLSHHLKTPDTSTVDELPRCRVFRTGSKRWEHLENWPATDIEDQSLYLQSLPAASLDIDKAGVLADYLPDWDSSISYVSHPENPVRLLTGPSPATGVEPPLDHHYLHRRSDVLAFLSDELVDPLSVSGRPRFFGYVSTDAETVDLIVTICDVFPDGRRIVVGGFPGWPGGLRLANRAGPQSVAMKPGDVVSVDIGLQWMHHVFRPGHRIALAIASSWYPWLAVSGNTVEHWADEVDLRVATVHVHTGKDRPSRISLPVERLGAGS